MLQNRNTVTSHFFWVETGWRVLCSSMGLRTQHQEPLSAPDTVTFEMAHWAPSIKNAEDSSSESCSAESSEITRNNRTALNLSPSKPARSLQKKIWRRLRERLSCAAWRLDEDSLEIHSPAVESIHSRWIDSTWFSSFIERPWIDSTHKIQRIQV